MSRFRVSPLGSSLASGVAVGGEVEDYIVEIIDGAPPVAVADSYTTDEDVAFNSQGLESFSCPRAAGQNQATLIDASRLAVGNGVIIRRGYDLTGSDIDRDRHCGKYSYVLGEPDAKLHNCGDGIVYDLGQ